MKNLILFSCLLQSATQIFAQHYSGYYVSVPPLDEYHHFKVHQKDHGSHLEVKALLNTHKLWTAEAVLLDKTKLQPIIDQFAEGADIDNVYKLDISFDGTHWKFFLLSYHDHSRNHGAFKVIEEVFDNDEQSKPTKIKKFEWYKSHHTPHHNQQPNR